MMCRIENGCCTTEETHCPVSTDEDKHAPVAQIGVSFYAQACKALAVDSPFDLEDLEKKSSATVTTLPGGLASWLCKHSDSRKKRKRSHLGSDTNKNKEKVKVNSIWSETEDYFKGVCLDDVERLNEAASVFRGNSNNNSLISIPYPGNDNSKNNINNNVNVNESSSHSEQDINHIMEVDGESVNEVSQNQQEHSGIEWLLGCRNKIYLAPERPSKKRKLPGEETRLEKLFVAQPVKDREPSTCCDYCSKGGTDDQLNRLIVCTSCGVAVHQRCYGVQQIDDAGWLCSWCRVKIDGEKSTDCDGRCLLCPQQGGALKPVKKRGVGDEDGGHVEFVHLFCCQWMTEVYIEDTKSLEPIMNVEGVKDGQKKLICYLCMVKCGACVRCSYGSCRTAFHPVCAREASHRMEIWGKFGCDDIEMRAFCLKHSEAPKEGGASIEDEVLNTSSSVKSKTDVDVADVKGSNTVEDVKVSDSSNLALLVKKKNLKLKVLSTRISNGEKASGVENAITRVPDNNVGSFSVKLGPPRKKAKCNIRVLKDNSFILSLKRSSADGVIGDEDKNGGKFSGQETSPDSTTSTESCPVSDLLVRNTTKQKGDAVKCSSPSQIGCGQVDRPIDSSCSITENNSLVATRTEASPDSYIHPLILMRKQYISEMKVHKDDGSGVGCNQQIRNSATESSTESGKTERMSIINMSPVDEVEGELVYHQHQLLRNAAARKHINDVLISKVTKCLPQEIEDVRKHNWDAVFVTQFLYDLKKFKKRGQKERRHKEAQAVLATATADAAASSRVSSLRKDTVDDSAHQENILKAKEAHSKLSVTTLHEISTLKNKGHSKVCDVCRRAETVLNPIIMCSSCKVTVHIDCYRSIKDSTGPWFCELCEDIWSSHVAECRLCCGTIGAFRKSTDGQWVHAFCAEWILESTFRRGQMKPIDCIDTIIKGNDICLVCSRKEGVCLKCNYGHCQSTFHATCGSSAGLFMNVRTIGGKLQHKAYCDKHSLVERTKAETQKYGVEEWNSLKKVRVELERLRLICERIIRREKLRRELVVCSHDTLRWNRESISSFTRLCTHVSPDVSSESATTSLKDSYTNSYKSCSETIQRSDDVTIDTTVTGKRRIRFSVGMDNDQKTDDSSISQIFTHTPTVRPLAGKQIPHRPSHTAADDVDKCHGHEKHTETFEKELLMTSDKHP
ncbi:uncharacterized protein LOC143625748 isoform X2 [Bidens hawaiensis]|uniref:uncharacterized protein LOC143625748 isoform X2 n=1 Tax=Bidens hawaiensis TaxID=980011 RepID=UPI0040494CB8